MTVLPHFAARAALERPPLGEKPRRSVVSAKQTWGKSKCCTPAPMFASGKLRRSDRPLGQGPLWAVLNKHGMLHLRHGHRSLMVGLGSLPPLDPSQHSHLTGSLHMKGTAQSRRWPCLPNATAARHCSHSPRPRNRLIGEFTDCGTKPHSAGAA
jgi:hypothetical protein